MEIGETGKRRVELAARRESVAIACRRAASRGNFSRDASDGGAEKLAQARFDFGVAGSALALAPCAQRNHRLRHVAMPAGAADIAEQILHHLARVVAAHAVIAHADDELAAELACDGGPRHALELQA